jgi:hypothetical protein
MYRFAQRTSMTQDNERSDTPALGDADRHRASYNAALARGDRTTAEREFAAEYDALSRAYPASVTRAPDGDGAAARDSESAVPAAAVTVSLSGVEATHHDAVREVIASYAADEDAVWRDWDAILAAHPDSDLFDRLDDPANDLILAAAWAQSSPHAMAMIARNPSLVTDPAAIEAAIAEARKMFAPGGTAANRLSPREMSMPVSQPHGSGSRDRWIAEADRARTEMNAAMADGDRRRAALWDAEERRLLGLVYGRGRIAG